MTLSELLGMFPRGAKKVGHDKYVVHCPHHKGGNEKHPSLNIKESPDGWLTMTCYVCGADKREEIMEILGLTWSDLAPAGNKKKLIIEETYTYVNESDEYMFEKVRLRPKKFMMRRFKDGVATWNMKGLPKDQWPLYKLPEIIKEIGDDQIIVFVEGEKDVNRLRSCGIPATTFTTGSDYKVWDIKSGKSAARLLSKGRVVFIPDNDAVGRKFAEAGSHMVKNSSVLTLEGLEPAGDVSDWLNNGGTKEELKKLIQVADSKKAPLDEEKEISYSNYFLPLGYDRGDYFVMSFLEQQVVSLSSREIARKTNLYRIAPKHFWEDNWPTRLGGFNADSAAAYLIGLCVPKGIYNYRSVRGRGVWLDDSRVVIHRGDNLIVDKYETPLIDFPSEYVYERERRIPLSVEDPMQVHNGKEFIRLCEMINWEDKVSGKLFAGWMFLAPICGALSWRPHIWMIGAIGSGKSWVFNNIIHSILNGVAVFTQSTTTEAALRQDVRNDAIPIIFDEAESDSRRNKGTMEKVLELARQASSDSAGGIMKGTIAGKALHFQVTSMFCFMSVSKSYMKRADQSRITSLPLMPPLTKGAKHDKFEQLVTLKNELMTHSFKKEFISRSCASVLEVRKNCELIVSLFGNGQQIRRDIDQYGAMIAGLWSLTHGGNIEAEFVEDIVNDINEADSIEFNDNEKDEIDCLITIMERRISVVFQTADRPVREDRTMGELIEMTDIEYEEEYSGQAQRIINQYGVKTDERGVIIANKHSELEKLLVGTRFQYGWATYLPRIPGVKKSKKTIRFNAYVVQRSVIIPWGIFRTLLREEEITEEDEVPF